jgi:hypothetical protein
MKIKDMESLIQITREIETQGYAVRSINSERKNIGHHILEIKILISRKCENTEIDNPLYIDPNPY